MFTDRGNTGGTGYKRRVNSIGAISKPSKRRCPVGIWVCGSEAEEEDLD